MNTLFSRSPIYLLMVFLSLGFSGCGKKEDSEDSEKKAPKILKAEDQQEDRLSRRDRLKRDREIYLARLKGSAKKYNEQQSIPVVESNMKIFKARLDGYYKEMYLPDLAKRGLKPAPFPSSIPKADSNRKMLGVNFYIGGYYQIPRERKAGLSAVEQGNWNNVSSSQERAREGEVIKGHRDGLILGSGQMAENLKLDWQANKLENRRNAPRQDTKGSMLLMSANLGGDEIAISLKGLAQSGIHRYDLIVYLEYAVDENQQDAEEKPLCRFDLWTSPEKKSLIASDLASGVKVSGNPYKGEVRSFTRQHYGKEKFVCANTGKSGHYLYFSGLTAPEFYFQLTPPVFGKVREYRLAGFQVIER
jgi:hypothetical protein